MLRQFTLSLTLAAAVSAQECDDDRKQFELPDGSDWNGDMSDTNNRRHYTVIDDDLMNMAISCY